VTSSSTSEPAIRAFRRRSVPVRSKLKVKFSFSFLQSTGNMLHDVLSVEIAGSAEGDGNILIPLVSIDVINVYKRVL